MTKIGIDASRAFIDQRTGIEECAYQIIKHLREELDDADVLLYVRKWNSNKIDFKLPKKWRIKEIPYVYGWTQIGLAMEMLIEPVDVFFSPAHTTAVIHPLKNIVTVHGLEYEHCPKSYSFYARLFHKFFIKRSCKWATEIIAVSKNTKKDLKEVYGVSGKKVSVVYNGYKQDHHKIIGKKGEIPYLFYVGRLEQRKNIIGIIRAFEILKGVYGYEGKLFLAGGQGHGYEDIKKTIETSKNKKDIKELGYISEEEKWNCLGNADVFLFPSFCEGFGIPLIEAQSVGVPTITSKIGPLDEVVGNEDVCVDPRKPEEIAKKAHKIISDEEFRKDVVIKGKENVKRFSWEKCAKETAQVIKRCC